MRGGHGDQREVDDQQCDQHAGEREQRVDEADEPGSSTAIGRSIQNHCAGDCSSCAVRSSKQLQRHKTTAVSLELPALAISLRPDESSEGFFNLHPEFDPFSPRGPPHSWT